MPAISPSRGEIGSFDVSASSPALAIGESLGDIRSPPLRG
ncbi:MAG: alpha/beta hydrolase, partial [Mesorhizobium sp.]